MANILYDLIIERKNELGVNSAELAQLAGVSEPTIKKLERGEDISLASLRDVCLAMDLVLTVVDRKEVVKKEVAAKDAEIERIKEQLRALEMEREALIELVS